MAADPENDFRPGDLKSVIWRKILARLQAQGIGTATSANLFRPGDDVAVIQRKVLTQLEP